VIGNELKVVALFDAKVLQPYRCQKFIVYNLTIFA